MGKFALWQVGANLDSPTALALKLDSILRAELPWLMTVL
jgi:hypothetical protein